MTDAPEESQEPGAPKEPQYQKASDELKRVLAEHKKWFQTAVIHGTCDVAWPFGRRPPSRDGNDGRAGV